MDGIENEVEVYVQALLEKSEEAYLKSSNISK